MKQIKNQSGITLIEVLATITILSIVSIIIYNVFFNGLQYSSQAKDTVSIQQEANYLLTILKEQHENAENNYTVTVENEQKTIIINKNLPTEIDATNPQYLYQICDMDDTTKSCDEQNATDLTITKTTKNNFYVKITLINKNNPNLTYEIKTILSRL